MRALRWLLALPLLVLVCSQAAVLDNSQSSATTPSSVTTPYEAVGYLDAGQVWTANVNAGFVDAGRLSTGYAEIGYVDAGQVWSANVNAGFVDAGNVGIPQSGKYCLNAGCTVSLTYDGTSLIVGGAQLNVGTNNVIMSSGTLSGANSSVPFQFKSNSTSGSGKFGFQFYQANTLSAGGIASFENPQNTPKIQVIYDGSLRMVGVANASLIACSGSTEGYVQYDTTNHAMVFCNGTVWKTVTTN